MDEVWYVGKNENAKPSIVLLDFVIPETDSTLARTRRISLTAWETQATGTMDTWAQETTIEKESFGDEVEGWEDDSLWEKWRSFLDRKPFE